MPGTQRRILQQTWNFLQTITEYSEKSTENVVLLKCAPINYSRPFLLDIQAMKQSSDRGSFYIFVILYWIESL